MWEIWDGDEFLFVTDDPDEATELAEAGYRVRNVGK